MRAAFSVHMRAHCKTGIAASKNGAIPHLVTIAKTVFEDGGKVRFFAAFLCGSQTNDAQILASAEGFGRMCETCEDIAKGPCMYRCFGSTGGLLYVGSTKAYLRRIQTHRTQTPWWPEVADIRIQRYPTLFEARVAERHAIDTESPLKNIAHQRKAGAA